MAKTVKMKLMYVRQDGRDFLPPELSDLYDVANWIQHRIITHRALGLVIESHTHRFPDGSYKTEAHPEHVPLMWDYLCEEMGKSAVGSVLRWMLDAKYVVRTDHYDEGVHPYGYRLGNKLVGETVRLPMTTGWLDRRLKRIDHANMKRWGKAHRHLRRWGKRIDADIPAMSRVLKGLDHAEHIAHVVRMIHDGDFHFKVCDQGRFHSAYTCLSRHLRGCLGFAGQKLVNVDIANSQPLFLGITILQDWRNGKWPAVPAHVRRDSGTQDPLPIRRQEEAGAEGNCEDEQGLTTQPEMPDCVRGDEVPEDREHGIPDDLHRYFRICQEGRLYGYLMDAIGWKQGKDAFKDKVWFLFLYGSNKEESRCEHEADLRPLLPLVRLFKNEFPTVYSYMWEAKKRNYRRLACRMQRVESRLMIDTVCGRLAEGHAYVPVVSIHDSLMTTPQYVPLVERLIEEEFAKLGVRPRLNVTDYSEPQGAAAVAA